MTKVFFDFDKTLTKIDTVTPFGFFLGWTTRKYFQGGELCMNVLRSKFGNMSNQTFKERFLQLLAAGESEESIVKISETFLAKFSGFLLKDDVYTILQDHRVKGDSVWLVSANFDFFLRPLEVLWGLAGIIATRSEVVQGRFTGRVIGNVCHGREKAERVLARFGSAEVDSAIAYGDSDSDSHLLGIVHEGYLVTRSGLKRFEGSRANTHLQEKSL